MFACRHDGCYGEMKNPFWKQKEPGHSFGKRASKQQLCPWRLPASSPSLRAARGVCGEMLDVPGSASSRRFDSDGTLDLAVQPPSTNLDLLHICRTPVVTQLGPVAAQGRLQNSACSGFPQQDKYNGDARHLQTWCYFYDSQVAHLYRPLFNLYAEL